MLSIRDCLDYCDLSDDTVALLAEHEDIPDLAAAHIACGLVQTPEGVLLLTHVMQELMERAHQHGDVKKAARIHSVCERFKSSHPLAH